MKLSVLIIAKNEEDMIVPAIESVLWADEVIVLDTGSTDKTVAVAKKAGATVYTYTAGKSFSDWRNKALTLASGDYVLYLDADERIPRKLQAEIQTVINQSEAAYFAIPRINVILGKELTHGGWWPDYVKRLYKKSALKKWEGKLHEEPVVEGSLAHLTNPMRHIKHETFSEMIEKTNDWSAVEAQLMFDAKHPPMTVLRFMSAMAREFWYRMVVKRAFLDGKEGVMFAMYQVYSRFISYAKLWEMQNT